MTAWISAKHSEFVRDILRDFCLTCYDLEQVFQHYQKSGMVDFEKLAALLGQEMNKGLLWQLKDTAHILFQHQSRDGIGILNQLLEWNIGYIFHNVVKLKEDAYQQQKYGPWLKKLERAGFLGLEQDLGGQLTLLLAKTEESMATGIWQISFLQNVCKKLFIAWLPEHAENKLLARLLYVDTAYVKEIFGKDYLCLLKAVYGQETTQMFLLAALSFKEGGWHKQACEVLEKALSTYPENEKIAWELALLQEEKQTPGKEK